MKTFRKLKSELLDSQSVGIDSDYMDISEVTLRQVGGVAIMMKVRNISQQVSRIKFSPRDEPGEQRKKLMLQNELIGKQNYYIGLLVAQLGVMSREKGDSK